MDNPLQSPAIISFCPGILGLERGLERAIGKLNVLAYCEIEAFICENLVAGMESGILAPAPIWTDAKTFPAQLFRGKVHGIIGGYPCQPFSTAGQRKGYEDPRHLWPHLRRHIDTIRPVWCFFENVRGHLSLGYETVQKELNDLGYSVEPGIFTAEEVGAPHQRERLFILALENSYLTSLRDNYRENRGRDWEQVLRQGNRQKCKVWAGTAGEVDQLAYANCDGSDGAEVRKGHPERVDRNPAGQESIPESKGSCSAYFCCEMVNASIVPQRKQTDETFTQSDEGEAREEPCFRCYKELAYPISAGFQAERAYGIPDEKNYSGVINADRWPARPGEQQYDWEEPRTIERGLGRTVDGYSFREDLLRALGNSVVEQTAEFAFITLLLKHLKNLS